MMGGAAGVVSPRRPGQSAASGIRNTAVVVVLAQVALLYAYSQSCRSASPSPQMSASSAAAEQNRAQRQELLEPDLEKPRPTAVPRKPTTSARPKAAPLPPGCRVCDAGFKPLPFKLPLPVSETRNCYRFWVMKYDSWKSCHAAAVKAREVLRVEACRLCASLAAGSGPGTGSGKPPTQGVVLGATGQKYILEAVRAVRMLRHPVVGYTGKIEVFSDKAGAPICDSQLKEPHGVTCRILDQKLNTGYTIKLNAVLQSSFDQVVMVDTDNFVLRSPDELFHDADFSAGKIRALGFPDLWGEACKSTPKWQKTETNPEGHQLCGQSAWREHVIWPVIDEEYQARWEDRQELDSTLILIDKRDPAVLLAWQLAINMTETKFFDDVLYGDKDTIRAGLILAGARWRMLPEPPGQVLNVKNKKDKGQRQGDRAYLISYYNGKPFTMDQVKGKPNRGVGELMLISAKVPPNSTSYCAPDYTLHREATPGFTDWVDFDPVGADAWLEKFLPVVSSCWDLADYDKSVAAHK